MPEEIKKNEARSPDLGQAQTPNLGQASSIPKSDKIEPEAKQEPPTDFKIAEVWIRSGQIMLDASESFWSDRCRAIGVLEFCKEIVKTAKAPEKPKIIIPGNGKMLNFARNLFKRRK